MSTFTKEQLIEQARKNIEVLEGAVTRLPGNSEIARIHLRLAEITLAALTAEPVAWTDEQELRDVEKDGCGYLFTINPITPNADPRRVIKLYSAPPAPVMPDSENGLMPCPFCGGKARQLTIEQDNDPHFGGDVITCTECGASSHVEFGFKENLKSAWNSRAAMLNGSDE
ncbi:Lar family restriction alleviation protein [Escherichia coli]|uniref:Lar family restriction alleviation protein n=1 Tax=Escherichia coli TaxID=562 RepID=UPI001C97A217|nr:Lar family restriction alleviation protein [Escherichia coli]